MKKKTPDILTNYFVYNISILKQAGLWFLNYDSFWKKVLFLIYNVICITYSFAYFYTTEIIFLIFSNDIKLSIKCACWLCTHTLVFLKTILWHIKRKQIFEVISTLQNEDYLYEPYNNEFEPTSILEKAKIINNIFLRVHYWGGFLIATTACLGATVAILLDKNPNSNVNICPNLPFPTWVPDVIRTTYTGCLLAIICQGLGILQLGYGIISMDGMFTTTLSFITAEFVILQGAFRTVRPRAMMKITSNNERQRKLHLDWQINKEFNKCFNHLQVLINASDKVESIYNYQTLGQALNTLFVFCGCLFLVSNTSMTNKLFLGEVFYMVTVAIEFSLYCWFGNELSLAGEAIPQALYESDWIEYSTKVKRSILITMIRMQIPVKITVGKFSPLTLDTLVAILRGSYSFFAVLQQVNEDEDAG